jgi:hypothetical protein
VVRYYYPFPPVGPVLYHMELNIGGQQFHGKGRTRQLAKHDAASKALKTLQKEPILLQQLPEVRTAWGQNCLGSELPGVRTGEKTLGLEQSLLIPFCFWEYSNWNSWKKLDESLGTFLVFCPKGNTSYMDHYTGVLHNVKGTYLTQF